MQPMFEFYSNQWINLQCKLVHFLWRHPTIFGWFLWACSIESKWFRFDIFLLNFWYLYALSNHGKCYTHNSLITIKLFVPWFCEFWLVKYCSPSVWGYIVSTKYESWRKCIPTKSFSQCLRYLETSNLVYIAN